MKLRKLSSNDCDLMYEWMHDDNVTSYLKKNFKAKSREDCKNFIDESNRNYNLQKEIHLAICNDKDEYLGTISLKNIDFINKNAEYAIVIREKAMGKGYAQLATKKILDIAFKKLELNRVYLSVIKDNIRAIKFYEKCNFKLEGEFRRHLCIENNYYNLLWYSILKSEYVNEYTN